MNCNTQLHTISGLKILHQNLAIYFALYCGSLLQEPFHCEAVSVLQNTDVIFYWTYENLCCVHGHEKSTCCHGISNDIQTKIL